MHILLINNGSTFLSQLQNSLLDHTVTTIFPSDIFSTNINPIDRIILSGGHTTSVQGHESIFSQEISFLSYCRKPTLGICLGAQIIAIAFGSRLTRLPQKRHGFIPINITSAHPLFPPTANPIVFESHRWVVSDLGQDLSSIAQSSDGIEAFTHHHLPYFGVQFHPEMSPDSAFGQTLILNFLNLSS